MCDPRSATRSQLPIPWCRPCLQSTGSATKPRPFKLSTDVRAEWEERLKPGHAKLSTEDLRALQVDGSLRGG